MRPDPRDALCAIAAQCRLGDRFLEVRGKLHTYRIHLGSANVQILPDNRYLCITRAPRTRRSAGIIMLPFEGDTILSLILSKAFLLAADDKIRDPSIVHQLHQR